MTAPIFERNWRSWLKKSRYFFTQIIGLEMVNGILIMVKIIPIKQCIMFIKKL